MLSRIYHAWPSCWFQTCSIWSRRSVQPASPSSDISVLRGADPAAYLPYSLSCWTPLLLCTQVLILSPCTSTGRSIRPAPGQSISIARWILACVPASLLQMAPRESRFTVSLTTWNGFTSESTQPTSAVHPQACRSTVFRTK